MAKHKEEHVYRPILLRSLGAAWRHRELWPVAALAGIAMSGTVLNEVFLQLQVAVHGLQSSGLFIGPLALILERFITTAATLSPLSAVGAFLVLFGLALLALLLIVACQHVLLRTVHRAAQKKASLTSREILGELRHHRFHSLVLVNLLVFFLMSNLMIGAGLMLRNLDTSGVLFDAIFGVIFAATVFFIALILAILGMFTAITVTHDEASISAAIGTAWRLVRSHLLINLEMAGLLFAVNFVLTAGYVVTVTALSAPAFLLLWTAIDTGVAVVVSITTILLMILFLTLTFAFAGFVVTFTYSTWTELFLALHTSPHRSRVAHHASKFAHAVRT